MITEQTVDLIKVNEQLAAANQELRMEISQYKLMEKKLHTSEAQIRAILEAITDIVLVIDDRGSNIKIAPTNPAFLYEPAAEIIDQTVNQFLQSEQSHAFLCQVWHVLETQQPLDFEYSLPLGDTQAWFLARISPFTSDVIPQWVRGRSLRSRCR